MPIPTFTGLPPKPEFGDVVNKVNTLAQEMTNLILNLDSLNVVSLTADHIDAGTIDANIVTIRSDLAAGAYVQIDGNGMVINNGSFNTFTADINGAVSMTSATIQSATGYPKVVMDPASTLFAAYTDSDTYIAITPDFLGHGPGLISVDGGTTMGGTYCTSLAYHLKAVADLVIEAGTDITFSPGGLTGCIFPSWSEIFSTGDSQTLQDALDGKQGTVSGGGSTITTANLTANRGLISNASGKVAVSATTSTEIGYVSGVTSAIQTQLNGKMTVLNGGTKIQSGSSSVVIAVAGTQVTSSAITFGTAFSSAPLVYCTLQTVSSGIDTYVNVATPSANVTSSQFTVIANSGKAQTIFFDWIAIGS